MAGHNYTDDRKQRDHQRFSWRTLFQAFCVCTCLFVYALLGEALTGTNLTGLLNALSDPSLLILLTPVLLMAIGIDFAFDKDWTRRTRRSVEKLVFDTYAFLFFGFVFASALLAYRGETSLAKLAVLAPIGLFFVGAGFYWAIDDFKKTSMSRWVRLVAGVILLFLGPFIIMRFQSQG